MKLQQELQERGKSKIQQWRAIMDELELQLALGKADAKDMIKEERQNLSTFLEQQKEQMNMESKKEEEQQVAFKQQLEDLYRLTDADLTKSNRSYTRKKKEILHFIHLTESMLKSNADLYTKWIGEEFEELKQRLDNYRIALALSSFQSVAEIEPPKIELREELYELIEQLTKMMYPEGNRVDHFLEEVSDSLEHLKKAFSDLLT